VHGRRFVDMVPTLTLDAVLPPADAATWHATVTPARQDDLHAP
jgi:hypothetical protein